MLVDIGTGCGGLCRCPVSPRQPERRPVEGRVATLEVGSTERYHWFFLGFGDSVVDVGRTDRQTWSTCPEAEFTIGLALDSLLACYNTALLSERMGVRTTPKWNGPTPPVARFRPPSEPFSARRREQSLPQRPAAPIPATCRPPLGRLNQHRSKAPRRHTLRCLPTHREVDSAARAAGGVGLHRRTLRNTIRRRPLCSSLPSAGLAHGEVSRGWSHRFRSSTRLAATTA